MHTPKIIIAALMVVFTIGLLMGCSVLDVAKQLKEQPEVMDVSLMLTDDTVHCEVILEETAVITDLEQRAQDYAAIVANGLKGMDIELIITLNNQAASRLSVEAETIAE